MLFNSYEFIFVFLPLVFLGFYLLLRLSRGAAWLWIAAASLFFYGWWNPRFVLLLLASAAFNFIMGTAIRRAQGQRAAKTLLALAVGANIALLGVFKYTNFFIATVNAVGGSEIPLLDIVLPLGISLFTFTQIAYLVDVYRGTAHEYSLVNYLAFVSFFPHLIAGPVLRHNQIVPQFGSVAVQPVAENVAVGLTLFAIGLAKKVLIADQFGNFVAPVFDAAQHGRHPGLSEAWTGALAYTFQLYFDFSGYSDMAIGLSRMFGITLPANFNSPYKAHNIIEFWRRWHMSLSQFLRDYLYIPLGGNRSGKARRYLNLMVTMLLGGLWHGANWTFVAWGGLHGVYLMVNHAWRKWRESWGAPVAPSRLGKAAGVAITFLAVVVSWVLFRADSLSTALVMLEGMIGRYGAGDLVSGRFLLMLMIAGPIVFLMPNSQEMLQRYRPVLESRVDHPLPAGRALVLNSSSAMAIGTLFFLAILFLGRRSVFLYYQF